MQGIGLRALRPLSVALLGAVFFMLASVSYADGITYRFDKKIATGIGFGHIALDETNNRVLAVDAVAGTIASVSTVGSNNVLTVWRGPCSGSNSETMLGIAISPSSGDVYTSYLMPTGVVGKAICKVYDNFAQSLSFGIQSPSSDIRSAYAVAVNNRDEIYIANYDSSPTVFNDNLIKIDRNLNIGWSTTECGYNPDGSQCTIQYPKDVAVDGDGNVYLTDRYGVYKYSSDGQYLMTFVNDKGISGGFKPQAIAVGPDGMVYVSDLKTKRVVIFNSEGDYIDAFGGAWFLYPFDIEVAGNGDAYVEDLEIDATGKPSGAAIDRWESPQLWLDGDGDGVPDHKDNCPKVANQSQADGNGNGVGDACESKSGSGSDGSGSGQSGGQDRGKACNRAKIKKLKRKIKRIKKSLRPAQGRHRQNLKAQLRKANSKLRKQRKACAAH